MLKWTTFIMIHYFNEGLIPKNFFFCFTRDLNPATFMFYRLNVAVVSLTRYL